MTSGLMTGTMVVSVIAMLGWLVLNLRALQAHQLGRERTISYALLWVAIFGAVAAGREAVFGVSAHRLVLFNIIYIINLKVSPCD